MKEKHELAGGIFLPRPILDLDIGGNGKVLLSLIFQSQHRTKGFSESNIWLASQVGLSVQRIADILTKLEKLGFIERVFSQDNQRSIFVRLQNFKLGGTE